MSLNSRENSTSSGDSSSVQSAIFIANDSDLDLSQDNETTDQDSDPEAVEMDAMSGELHSRSNHIGGDVGQLDFQRDLSSSESETDLSEQLRNEEGPMGDDSSSSSENTEIWVPSHQVDHSLQSPPKPTPPPRPTHIRCSSSGQLSRPSSIRHSIISQNSTGRIETMLGGEVEPIYVNGIPGMPAMIPERPEGDVRGLDDMVATCLTPRPPTPPQSHPSILRNPGDVGPTHDAVQRDFRDALHTTISSVYALVLTVSGVVLPIAQVYADKPGPGVEIFFIYLYVMGTMFLGCAYVFMLHHSTTRRRRSRRGCNGEERDPLKSPKRHKQWLAKQEQQAIGSFYLRLGALGFGIGAMIHEGLKLGELLEMGPFSPCVHVVLVVHTVTKLLFIFIQLYFVFLNAKLQMQRHRTLSKYGLMHLLSTNACMWSRTIVVETLRQLQKVDTMPTPSPIVNGNYSAATLVTQALVNTTATVTQPPSPIVCRQHGILGQVVRSASIYLYPCTVEYALISLGILSVLWHRVQKRPPDGAEPDVHYIRMKRNSSYVDCSQANKGMFLGIFTLVASIISMIIFFVLSSRPGYERLAFMVAHTSEVVLYILATIAVCIAFQRMFDMMFIKDGGSSLDEILMWISLAGVFVNSAFNILPARYNTTHQGSALGILRSVIVSVQAAAQTIFIMTATRRSPCKPQHEMQKPGREFITFLIACNVGMWGLNTLEALRATSNPLALQFYGVLSWSIIMHITTPLAIFYRFHSTVCLATIWKNAYKLKSN